MDPASTFIIIWILLALLACAGSAAQALAGSVDSLEPSLLAGRTVRVRRLNWGGAMLGTLALVAAVAVAVLGIRLAGGNSTEIAIGAALSVLFVRLAQETAAWMARENIERLAKPLLGDDLAVFLPLIEPHPQEEPQQAAQDPVEQMVDAGEKAGLIESDEHEMITGILGLDKTAVREIMVPRIDVVAVEVEAPFHSAIDVVIGGAHSRVPVYEESIDHIIGLLYAKDILKVLRDGDGKQVTLRSLLRPAYFVPESKRVDELLQELQQSKVHMAIVVDEYGGTAGIVTIEDILEEIVGEIQDEYDIGEEPLIERVGENEGIFNARVNIDEVNDALEVKLPEESDTLGGLVYQHLQKMPKVGDEVQVDGVTISVLSVVGRRIKKVRVSKIVEPAHAGSADSDEEKATQ